MTVSTRLVLEVFRSLPAAGPLLPAHVRVPRIRYVRSSSRVRNCKQGGFFYFFPLQNSKGEGQCCSARVHRSSAIVMQYASAKASFGRGRHRGVAESHNVGLTLPVSFFRLVQGCVERCPHLSIGWVESDSARQPPPTGPCERKQKTSMTGVVINVSIGALESWGEGVERRAESHRRGDVVASEGLFPKAPPPPRCQLLSVSCQSPSSWETSWGECIGSRPKGPRPSKFDV
ncbi:hypothetical protein LZ32DRAFT_31627 [Colletotrichum eremochloae]|nr:hypothetical protein LZ32DRAFT_31627 [Colletotrichum eremochloae]